MGPTEFGQTYNSSDMQQLIGVLALREERALRDGARASRKSKQLSQIGKIQGERKLRGQVPDAFADQLPLGHAFTCVTVFESILRGEIKPLYDLSGKISAAPDTNNQPAAAP